MASRDFHHPFEPYPIQKEFMNALYSCIEEGKVGIFESPTGTGKSLSLICGSLTWLREYKRRNFDESLIHDPDDDDPEWMIEHARKQKRRVVLQQRQDLENRLIKVREKEKKIKQRYNSGEPMTKRRKVASDGQDESVLQDDQFLLDDYESDMEGAQPSTVAYRVDYGLSAETQAMMKKLGMSLGGPSSEDDPETPDELKVFYCSRTHSQLSQFANELKRVRLPPAIQEERPDTGTALVPTVEIAEELKHLTLGSRKNLCINPSVKRLGNPTAINERCLELQQPGTSADCKCPHLPNKENEALVHEFRDHALASIRDIEDLGLVGKKLGICPYYASRPAVKPSEIVTLPYPLLLQRSAREALDISLKDHVVIIDEAHNLMNAITGIYSVSVTQAQFERGRGQLMVYLQKFRNRLKGKNRVYVTQMVRLLDSIVTYAQSRASAKNSDGQVPVGDLLAGKGVDQINLYKLARYLQESKLARKVDGYIVHTEQESKQAANMTEDRTRSQKSTRELSVPILTHIQGFLLALMNPSAEGSFFYARSEDGSDMSLKYMLLDPTYHFKEIVEEARAVVLAGGTMSPMDDYINHLFSYIPSNRLITLSCGHVIPPSNLLAWPICKDSRGADFDFTFEKRNSKAMIESVGHAILQLIKNIPDGVVAFFPSYSYLDSCVAVWKRCFTSAGSPKNKSLWELLSETKPIFLEPRSDQSASDQRNQKTGPAATEALLSSYSTAITASTNQNGALLLSVINGSLSEGINFSDRLGRAVIVIGLPFPNPHSAEWKAKMDYISQKAASSATSSSPIAEGKAAAREFYENATMRAVNQAVGRAIRHKDDYAAILLIDRRYGSERIQGKLPGWIKGSLRPLTGMEKVKAGLKEFFATKSG